MNMNLNMNMNMDLNLMHQRSLMFRNESEFESNCCRTFNFDQQFAFKLYNSHPKSNLDLNLNTKLNRTSGPNSLAAEAQPVAKLQPKLQLQPQPQPKPSNRVWMCDIFDRLRYALRVLPAETRLTVYRRFEIVSDKTAFSGGQRVLVCLIFNIEHLFFKVSEVDILFRSEN